MDSNELLDIVKDLKGFSYKGELKKNEFPSKKWNLDYGFSGNVEINGTITSLIVAFNKHYPYNKPIYFLQEYGTLGFIPHVESDGYICYTEDNIVLNPKLPKEILEDTMLQVLETLKKGQNKINDKDFVEEFEDYWFRNQLKHDTNIISSFKPTDEVQLIRKAKIGGKIVINFDDNSIIESATRFHIYRRPKPLFRNCIYIPLEKPLLPPNYFEFWSSSQFKSKIYDNISTENKEKLNKILDKYHNIKKEELIIISQPKSSGISLYGVIYKNLKEDTHPLLIDDSSYNIKPVDIVRLEKEIIKPRGGGELTLNNKKILLVGCGSVGSILAPELIKFGIDNITIVDNDFISKDNIYRHQLGLNFLSINKANAMSKFLEENYPFTTIIPLNNFIENLVSNSIIDLQDYDLIISATGSPNTNFYLNDFLRGNNIKTPIIYCWNEPYGIGGHCLLVQNKISCYNCLYDENLANKGSFCLPGQHFSKKIAGCSSSFVPFSSLDSHKTAVLTLGIIKNFFKGDITNNPYLSWKGDNQDFVNAGFKTSNRFELSENKLFDTRYEYNDNKCSTCKIK